MKKQKTIKLTEDEHTREMQEIAKMRANYLNDRSADGHKDESKFTISENVQVFNPDFRPDTPLDTLQARLGHVADDHDETALFLGLAAEIENAHADHGAEHGGVTRGDVVAPGGDEAAAVVRGQRPGVGDHVGQLLGVAILDGLGLEVEQFDQALVDDRDDALGVAHAQAVGHAVQRGAEAVALDARLAPAPARYIVSPHAFAKKMIGPLLQLVARDPVVRTRAPLLPKFAAGGSMARLTR